MNCSALLLITVLSVFVANTTCQFGLPPDHPGFEAKTILLGPHENATSSENVDNSHRELIRIAKTVTNFKEALGFNFTGNEILCNCSSSFCGSRDVTSLLNLAGYPNTCVGQVCYRQKRKFLYKGRIRLDEHFGCYGGSQEDHGLFHFQENLLCADRVVNEADMMTTRCCRTGFCHSEIDPFPYPEATVKLPSTTPKYSSVSPIFWLVVIFIFMGAIAGTVGAMIFNKRHREWVVRIRCALCGSTSANTPSGPVPPKNLWTNFRSLLGLVACWNVQTTEADEPEEVALMDNGAMPLPVPAHNHLEIPNQKEDSTALGLEELYQLGKDLVLGHQYEGGSSSCTGEVLRNPGMANQLTLMDTIGRGRYGTVYLGHWKGQNVAVKTFTSREEASFLKETAIYSTDSLRHANVLQFLGIGQLEIQGIPHNLMLFEFHPFGSLDSYLRSQPISVEMATRMVYSLASGLSFLHNPIETNRGTLVKRPMAHRDLKTANLLVKQNGMLCIADLGLSVVMERNGWIGVPDGKHHLEDVKPKDREAMRSKLDKTCGSVRYLAPELLDGSFDFEMFDAFKAADCYGMGLVIYEICRRTQVAEDVVTPWEQSIPYFRQVAEAGGRPGNVTIPVMRTIVVVNGERPDRTPWWQQHPVLKELDRLMTECWGTDPHGRVSADYVIKAVQRLAYHHHIDLTQS